MDTLLTSLEVSFHQYINSSLGNSFWDFWVLGVFECSNIPNLCWESPPPKVCIVLYPRRECLKGGVWGGRPELHWRTITNESFIQHQYIITLVCVEPICLHSPAPNVFLLNISAEVAFSCIELEVGHQWVAYATPVHFNTSVRWNHLPSFTHTLLVWFLHQGWGWFQLQHGSLEI